jgi:uncharacterized membrane protein HdeD (DUF308 family)
VAAKFILAVLAVMFLVAAVVRLVRVGGLSHPQAKSWLLVSVIFAVVSAWLFSRQ